MASAQLHSLQRLQVTQTWQQQRKQQQVWLKQSQQQQQQPVLRVRLWRVPTQPLHPQLPPPPIWVVSCLPDPMAPPLLWWRRPCPH